MTNRNDDGPVTTALLILAAAACGFFFGVSYGDHHPLSDVEYEVDLEPADASQEQYGYRDPDGGATSSAFSIGGDLTSTRGPAFAIYSTGWAEPDAAYPEGDWRHWRGMSGGAVLISHDDGGYDTYDAGGTSPCIRGCLAMYTEPSQQADYMRRWYDAGEWPDAPRALLTGARGCMRACVHAGADKVRWQP